MKRIILLIIVFGTCLQTLYADVIVTKENRKFKGTIAKIADGKFILRTNSGSILAIPRSHVARIYRDNKLLDFEENMSYYVEKRHPYLPFIVLSVASGAYSINRYQEYKRRKDSFNEYKNSPDYDPELQNITDNSGKALAESIIFGLFSAGSLYFAVKPLEVRVPIGKISMGTTPSGVRLSFNF